MVLGGTGPFGGGGSGGSGGSGGGVADYRVFQERDGGVLVAKIAKI